MSTVRSCQCEPLCPLSGGPNTCEPARLLLSAPTSSTHLHHRRRRDVMAGGAHASPAFAPCSPPTHTPPLSDPPPRAPTLRPRPYSSSIGTRPPALRSCCPPSRFAPPWPPPIRTAREASSTPSRSCSVSPSWCCSSAPCPPGAPSTCSTKWSSHLAGYGAHPGHPARVDGRLNRRHGGAQCQL